MTLAGLLWQAPQKAKCFSKSNNPELLFPIPIIPNQPDPNNQIKLSYQTQPTNKPTNQPRRRRRRRRNTVVTYLFYSVLVLVLVLVLAFGFWLGKKTMLLLLTMALVRKSQAERTQEKRKQSKGTILAKDFPYLFFF